MSKVFIVQRVLYRNPMTGLFVEKFDTSAALKYGSTVDVLPADYHAAPRAGGEAELSAKLLKGLDGFTADDYLLLSGDPVAIAVAAFLATEMAGGKIKILRWERKAQDYTAHSFDLYALAGINNDV